MVSWRGCSVIVSSVCLVLLFMGIPLEGRMIDRMRNDWRDCYTPNQGVAATVNQELLDILGSQTNHHLGALAPFPLCHFMYSRAHVKCWAPGSERISTHPFDALSQHNQLFFFGEQRLYFYYVCSTVSVILDQWELICFREKKNQKVLSSSKPTLHTILIPSMCMSRRNSTQYVPAH